MTTVPADHIADLLDKSTFHKTKLGDKTFVLLAQLPSGFEITTAASCVNPEEYSEEIGETIARKKLEDKLWELEGYLAQNRIADVS